MLNMDEVRQTITQILDGFCENRADADLFPAVELLKACYERLPAGSQTDFFRILAERLQSEPIPFPSSRGVNRSSHVLVIRAWAAFGPADALPKLLFSLLRPDTREAMESWALMIGAELLISLSSYSTRFSEAALATIKGQCALITCDQAIELADSSFPPALVEFAQRLENLVKDIEFKRNVVQKLRPQLNAATPAAPKRDATREMVVKTAAKLNPCDATLWRDLYDRFKLLVDEQQRLPEERRLRVYCDYTNPMGAVSWLNFKPEFGKWTYSKAVDHVFWKKFEAVATLAGGKLGPPKNIAAPSTVAALMGNVSDSVYWLHKLYDYLLKNASPDVSAADDKRGVIKNVCQASAVFCANLAKEEAVSARYAPEVYGSESIAETESPRAQDSANSPQDVKSKSADRHAMVKAYIEEVRRKTGKRITKKDIWSKAGYQTRTEFERWERQDSKHPNKAADQNFTRILRVDKPHLK
jgi:hypothetical protein